MSACRWTSSTTPRTVVGRHEDELGSDPVHVEACKGCLPCVETHCLICGINHVREQTCPTCISVVRSDLATIAFLMDDLAEQATEGSNANGRLLAQAEIPGGEAMLLMGPASVDAHKMVVRRAAYSAIEAAQREPLTEALLARIMREADDIHPLLLLATWKDDWQVMMSEGGICAGT